MAGALTTEETLKLRAFQRQVDRIRQSSIVQQGKLSVSTTTNIDFKTGEMTASFTGYDPVAFQAQLPILRQFMIQDSVNFGHICNIVHQKCGREELTAWIAEARRRWNQNLQVLPGVIEQRLHQVDTSVEQAIERIFYGYGGLFHVNIHDPEESASVAAIEESRLHRMFPRIFWCLNAVDSVIFWWLDAPEEDVPPVKTG